jgi:CrcB-like protein, Camphor Resistance (CrcB)
LTLHQPVVTFAAMGMGSPETARMGLMTPTAQYGGRTLSAAGRLFFALRHGNSSMGYLIVFLGGGIGAALRHGFNLAFARLLGNSFPHATLFENVSGSIVMGMLVGYFAFKGGITQHWRVSLLCAISSSPSLAGQVYRAAPCHGRGLDSAW